jgi:hypothetical protein
MFWRGRRLAAGSFRSGCNKTWVWGQGPAALTFMDSDGNPLVGFPDHAEHDPGELAMGADAEAGAIATFLASRQAISLNP